MTLFNVSRNLLAGIAFTLLNLGPANAGKIATPIIFIGGNDQLLCIANNVSTQSITVRVRIIGFFASSDVETCTLPVGEKFGCQQFLDDQSGHCSITSVGISDSALRERVRGVLFSRKTSPPFPIDAIVQAE